MSELTQACSNVLAELSPPEQKSRRDRSPKGSASGWSEERVGDLKRKNPTMSYCYRWDEPDDSGTVNLPIEIAPMVKRIVEVERQPVSKVLEFIRSRKKQFKGEL